MVYEVGRIASLDEFRAAGAAWNDLVARATLKNCFYRHEWFSTWLEHLAPRGELCVVTLAQGGRLVAAAPLQIVTQRRRGIPLKILEFLQSGITPRSGLLVEDDSLCRPLLDAVISCGGWHLAELRSLELQQATTRRFAACLAERGVAVAEAWMSSPYALVPDSWDAYYGALTGTWRRQFRRVVNRINRSAAREVVRLDSYAELDRHFAELQAISAASWKREEGTDMASLAKTAAFFRDYSRRTDGRGAWVVYLMRLEGRPVAFMYLLRDGSHWVALRSDYDEEFSYYMPGVYLHREAIMELTALPPPRIYDLGGWTTPFKRGLANAERPLCDLTFAPSNILGILLMAAKRRLAGRAGSRQVPLDQVIAGTVPPPATATDADEPVPGSPPALE